ncbi:MAG: hypothetical protein GXP62_04885 [Oligoflexia bacterium]|nr:hypothetical protein [Oligoflexia bacterium]
MRPLSTLFPALLPTLLLSLSLSAAAQDIPAARVVLPWQDFKTLWEAGHAPKDKLPPAPRAYAISSAEYVGSVDGEAAVFRATLKVDVLNAKGWTAVPILPTSVALRSAKVSGRDASVYLDSGWYTFITDKSGPVSIDLEFAVTTFDEGGLAGFSFALPQSGGTQVELSVPSDDDLDFDVANAQQVTNVHRGGRRVMRALLPADGNLSVSWQRSTESTDATQSARTPRIYAEHQALVGVGEGLLTGRSIINYSILFAGTDTFAVDLPADVTVLDVTGQGLGDWSVTEQDDRKVVTASLNFQAKGAYALTLDYESPFPDGGGSVTLPDLHVRGAERVKGFVGVDARSNLEVKAGDATIARLVDVRDLPAAILGQTDWPVLLGYRYGKEGWSIPIEVLQHDDVDMLVTIIDQAAATTVITPDGRRMTQVTYAMRNNRAQFLSLEMPAGATPWSTFVGGKAVKPALGDDGRLLIPLARSQASGGDLARFAVELVYVEDGGSADGGANNHFAATLPSADIPATAVAWTVYVPNQAKLRKASIDGTLRQVDWFTPIDLGGVSSDQAVAQVQQQAQALYDSDAMGAGVQPVRVALPIDGTPLFFEKLLVMSDPLQVDFDYRLKR